MDQLLNGERQNQIVFRPISRSDDDIVTQLDDLYLQYFQEKKAWGCWIPLSMGGENIGIVIIPKQRTELMISSEATRCAILAFASFRKSGSQHNHHTMKYLGRCYKSVRQSLSSCPSL